MVRVRSARRVPDRMEAAHSRTTWFGWIHAALIVPLIQFWEVRVLLPWEELVTSSIRHGFQEAARTVNGASSWLLSIFNARHRQSLQEAWQHNPWQKWWRQVEERPNTLNALLAALTQQRQDEDQANTTQDGDTSNNASDSPDRPNTDNSFIPQTRHNSAPSTSQWGFQRAASTSATTTQASSWYSWASQATQQRPAQQPLPRAPQASKPVQGSKSSQTKQAKQAAAAAKAMQRPVMFFQHSGQGVLDAASAHLSRTTGLLEDSRLAVEVHTARFFAAARSAVRSFFGLPPLSGPSAVTSSAKQTGNISLLDQELWRPGPVLDVGRGVGADAPAGMAREGRGVAAGGRTGGGGGGGGWSWSAAGTGVRPPVHVARSHSAHVAWAFSPPQSPGLPSAIPALPSITSSSTTSVSVGGAPPLAGSSSTNRSGGALRKTASFSALEEVVTGRRDVSVADVIRLAGYPLEVHTCTTPDGYILCMERIPRHGSRDVVFFLHGLLDTSMSWVSAGVTGSQAFAAWDMGYDVWLANSRCNAPRLHQDPMRAATSPAYWRFSVNEMGELDIGSQLKRVHEIKCNELQQGQAIFPVPPIVHTSGSATTRRGGSSLTARGFTSRSQTSCPASTAAAQAPPTSATTANIPPTRPQSARLAYAKSRSAVNTINSDAVPISPSAPAPPASWATRAHTAFTGPFRPWSTPQSQENNTPEPSSSSSSTLGTSTQACAQAVSMPAHMCTTATPPSAVSPSPDSRAMSPDLCDIGNTVRGAISTSGSDAEFFDAEEAGMHVVGWDRMQGGWPTLMRAAASDGDLLSVAGATANGTQAASWLTAENDAVKRVPDPTANYSQSSSATLDTPDQCPTTSFSPEAPSTPTPSSPRRSPPPADLSDSDANRNTHYFNLGHPHTSPSQRQAASTSSPGLPAPHNAGPASFNPWSAGNTLAAAVAAVPAGAFAAAAAVRTITSAHTQTQAQGSFRRATSASQLDTLASAVLPLPPLSTATDTTTHRVRSPNVPLRSPGPIPFTDGLPSVQGGRANHQQPTTSKQPGVLVNGQEPYRLRVVAHSMGGMSILVYLHRMAVLGRPAHVHRLVLLTPAGFHSALPNLAVPISWIFPFFLWLFRMATYPWWRNLPKWRPALPLYIPTTTLRQLIFKLMADLRQMPSMAELLRLGIKLLFSDDASQWDRALQMPHYSAKAMPAVSMDAVLHMTQCARSHHFRLFDYGSASANKAVYGQPLPPDVAGEYWRFGDLPIDLVAGAHDGIIPPSNVRRHYQAMMASGCKVTYKEFEFGHLDFTFAVKDELKVYLLRALRK